MAKSKGNNSNNAQFTYDFGIAIAQSTVAKVTRLTGATLTLASAFYALKTAASEYVDTLKENTLRFGGVLSTMKAMEQAQNRLIKGQSYFSMDDQLRGMNRLMSVGIDVGENIEWINKAAHATGKSFSEFSDIITSAIQGNSQALVDAGLMTQRATRIFDKFEANTIMRQQAILNFVKTHKGLMNAIKNDFETVQDQMRRIRGTWKAFLQSVMGRPNDPQSFYGQIVSSMKMVATALESNMEQIKRYGFIIGQTLGWVIKQIGHFVVWVGRQVKKALESVWSVTDDFQNQARSLLVWLEFWKLKVVDFFNEYGGAIKSILKLLIAYKALKYVFVIGDKAIKSVKAYRAALIGTAALQKRYMASMGPYVGKAKKFFQSLAVWLPRPFRKAWVAIGKFFADFGMHMRIAGRTLLEVFKAPFRFIAKGFRLIIGLIRNLPGLIGALFKGIRSLWTALNATNPLGWIILAITLLVTLYNKSEGFRKVVNSIFKGIWEFIKLIWNSLMYIVTWIMVGFKKLWEGVEWLWDKITGFFEWIWGGIQSLWESFMNTKVGKWIDDHIIQPLMGAFDWIKRVWDKVVKGIGRALEWLGLANDSVSAATEEVAEKYGVPKVPTAKGGHYDPDDSENYIQSWLFGRRKKKKKDKDSEPDENPLLVESGMPFGGGGGGSTTNMTFGNGAIQIIVQNGSGIDERILAQKIKGVLNDLRREGDMRGGTI